MIKGLYVNYLRAIIQLCLQALVNRGVLVFRTFSLHSAYPTNFLLFLDISAEVLLDHGWAILGIKLGAYQAITIQIVHMHGHF